MRISDWISDVCSSDLPLRVDGGRQQAEALLEDRIQIDIRLVQVESPGLDLREVEDVVDQGQREAAAVVAHPRQEVRLGGVGGGGIGQRDRKSTRLNSSH